jgi:ABC-type multidrug transport system ATPase subunit
LLLDLIRPTSGRASVLGLDTRRDAVAIKARVGYVAGDPALYERLTPAELFDWLARLRGGVDQQWLDNLVERFGVDLRSRACSFRLSTELRRRTATRSGGAAPRVDPLLDMRLALAT